MFLTFSQLDGLCVGSICLKANKALVVYHVDVALCVRVHGAIITATVQLCVRSYR